MTDQTRDIVERLRRWWTTPPNVKLFHGQYPMRGKPQCDEFVTVWEAKRAVHSMYRDKWGWWFQITKNGKEVWSSDHELAALSNAARGEDAA